MVKLYRIIMTSQISDRHHRLSSISISDHLRSFRINPDLAAAALAVNETEMPAGRPLRKVK
jgi:hypothetical protein